MVYWFCSLKLTRPGESVLLTKTPATTRTPLIGPDPRMKGIDILLGAQLHCVTQDQTKLYRDLGFVSKDITWHSGSFVSVRGCNVVVLMKLTLH